MQVGFIVTTQSQTRFKTPWSEKAEVHHSNGKYQSCKKSQNQISNTSLATLIEQVTLKKEHRNIVSLYRVTSGINNQYSGDW